MVIKTKDELLSVVRKVNGNLYIAGAGSFGLVVGNWLNKNKVEWKCFLDIEDRNTTVCGKSVIRYKKLWDVDFVIISSVTYAPDIKKTLMDLGVPEEYTIEFHNNSVINDILVENRDEELSKYTPISAYKNLHKNKACFIIGNGPSLGINDLNKIIGNITFACNSIYAIYENTKWRPTYYCSSDTIGMRYMMSDEIIKKFAKQYKAFFTGLPHFYLVNPIKDKLGNIVFFKTETNEYSQGVAKFSDDASGKLYFAGSITYYMIQLAVYMGFSEIYLLGIDFTFSNERHLDGSITHNEVQDHFDSADMENKKLSKSIAKMVGVDYLADTDEQLCGYRAARKYADEHGIHIYNATRGGKLEVFDRVDIDSLFTDGKFTPEKAVVHPRKPWYKEAKS